jgi:8-oxo-dGTP pyrophosphatase MutT (NUDIX family)
VGPVWQLTELPQPAYHRLPVRDIEREAARLLVRAADGQVLLLRLEPTFRGPFWVTPGGGLDDGESFEDAARRELREEVGLDAPIGACIWQRKLTFTWEDWRVHQPERTYLIEVAAPFEAVTTHPDEEPIVGSAWFSPEAIRAIAEPVYPVGLADLLDALAEGGVPASPIDLGVVIED